MKKFSKKVMCFMMSAILGTGMLAGCGDVKNEEPKDAIGMMKQYAAALENAGNYRIDGTISMKSGFSWSSDEKNGGSFDFDFPIDMKFDATATSSGEKVHGNFTLDMDSSDMAKMFSGEEEKSSNKKQEYGKQSFSFEFYSEKDKDNITVYTKSLGQDGWQKSTQRTKEDPQDNEYTKIITEYEDMTKSLEVFKDAEFKVTEETYEVTAPLSSIFKTSNIKDEIEIEKEAEKNDSSWMTGKNYFDINEMFDQLDNASIKLTFDKNTKLLKNIKLNDLSYKTPADENKYMGMSFGMDSSLSIDINITDYGNVSESEYTVPDSVKNSAS